MNLQPLTDAELDKLADVLKRYGDKRAMNLEMLDGFFAALICGPNDVPPSEFLSRNLGRRHGQRGSRPDQTDFAGVYFARRATLERHLGFLPLLLNLMMRVASLAPMIGPTASCANGDEVRRWADLRADPGSS